MSLAPSQGALVAISLVATVLYLLYRYAKPNPIPGIPHNAPAAQSILGDIPNMMEHVIAVGEFFPWLALQTVKLGSPIVQVFVRPLGKPWVIISDFHETRDILMRRTKEFDRGVFPAEVFSGVVPEFHMQMQSDNPKFKANRFIMNPLMTPSFLNEVAAPQIYANSLALVDLWSRKMTIARGHPFSATGDIYNGALDSIFAVTFGPVGERITATAIQAVSAEEATVEPPTDPNQPVQFPQVERPSYFEAIVLINDSMGDAMKSPMPALQLWTLKQMPYMRRATRIKEDFISSQLEQRAKCFTTGDQKKRSALDDILLREMAAAEKEGRPPRYKSRAIFDELFGFLAAGHETTSTTMCWAMKNLTDNQNAQQRLYSELRQAYADAAAEGRNPTVEEITRTPIHYLDAVIEEVLRKALTFGFVERATTTDCTVLGHRIPKGTTVILLANGPGYLSAPFDVPVELRSDASRTAKTQVKAWPVDDIAEFRPERWLVTDGQRETFDPSAGPTFPFGLGPRGCYGRRMAYTQLRILTVLIVWNFELQRCPDALSSYVAVQRATKQPQQCYIRLARR